MPKHLILDLKGSLGLYSCLLHFFRMDQSTSAHIRDISGFNPVRPRLHSAWKRDPSSARLVVHKSFQFYDPLRLVDGQNSLGLSFLFFYSFFLSVSVLPRLVRCFICDM
jgi:hypothetical protein